MQRSIDIVAEEGVTGLPGKPLGQVKWYTIGRGGWRYGPLARPKTHNYLSLRDPQYQGWGGERIRQNLRPPSKKSWIVIYTTPPISKGNQHQTELDQNRAWRGTSSCHIYMARHIIWPLPTPSLLPAPYYPRGWSSRKGGNGACASHLLCFPHPEVMLRPVLQGGERVSFNRLWNWAGLLISKSDKKVMESAEDAAAGNRK